MKTKIHAKAMEIINGHEQRTRSNTEKDIKNMDSTVAGSVEQRSK